MSRPRRELRPEDILALVDTREQLPLDLTPLRMAPGSLDTGDYSVSGLESHIAIERKSLPDLLGCIGVERDRFEREIMRLLAYPVRAVVVEASWAELEAGQWRSKVTPRAAQGSCLGWMAAGVPFLFAGNRAGAATAVSRMLFIAARRRWDELAALQITLRITPADIQPTLELATHEGFEAAPSAASDQG